MPYSEFNLWQAYFYVERANYSQTDINIAQLCSMFANANFIKANTKMTDYLPELRQNKKKDTQKELSVKLKTLSNMVNMVK